MAQLIRRESLHGFVQLIDELGGDVSHVLASCRLSNDVLIAQSGFLLYSDYIRLLETASEQLHCPDFGIRLAAKQNIDILGPLALAAKQATTLEEALSWVVKYIHFHVAGLEVRLTKLPNSDEVLLSMAIALSPSQKATQTLELTVALGCQFANFLSNGQCHINAVHFPHSYQPGSWHAKQVFRCAVFGDRPMAAIVLAKADLAMPVHCQQNHLANAAMAYLEKHCSTQTMSLTKQVQVLVKAMLMFELCSNEVIAAALDLSVRQLHRKLAEEGTSFVKVKNQVRKELAQYYLCQKNLSLGRIAEFLGYQEQSAFTKACQGWFGCSARQARYNFIGLVSA